jgi:hypothetical protein
MTVVYGAKYVYKSTLNSQVGSRLSVVPIDNPLLTASRLPFTIRTQVNTNQENEVAPSDEQVRNIVQNEIDLNSQFGRLLCAILFHLGFEKSHMIISENGELASCRFTTGSKILTFNQILVSLAMSIIEREYDRENLEFEVSKQLFVQTANIIARADNHGSDRGIDKSDCFYLLIQSLYEYIDSKFWSSFPWCCAWTTKAKQRHQLQAILGDLLSLTTNDIPKNKEIYREVQVLRLQKLANLKFPAADKREVCARPIDEIYAWQAEQNIEGIPAASAPLEKY